MKKLLFAAGVATASLLPSAALAQNSVDYSPITGAVDFSAAITALMAVAAVVALVLIARKGIRFVLGALK